MQKTKSLIIDDEANSRENIKILLDEFCPNVQVIGLASNLIEAENQILNLNPQLVFLDIQLGTDTVFSLLKSLGTINFEIIFVTAHDHFALKAFEFTAVDYLLKPVEIPKLKKAVNNAAKRIAKNKMNDSLAQMMLHIENFNRDQHKIALSTANSYEMVYINKIMYCIADGSYTQFCFDDGSQMVVSKNLKYYEGLLTDYGFERCHNTSLVNLKFIKKIEKTGGGAIIMEDDKSLPISKLKRQELTKKIKENRRLT